MATSDLFLLSITLIFVLLEVALIYINYRHQNQRHDLKIMSITLLIFLFGITMALWFNDGIWIVGLMLVLMVISMLYFYPQQKILNTLKTFGKTMVYVLLYTIGSLMFYVVMEPWVFVGSMLGFVIIVTVIVMRVTPTVLRRYFKLIPYEHGIDDLPWSNRLKNQVYIVQPKTGRLPMNALFLGIVKQSMVMLSNTLVARLNYIQVKAIIAHELGHKNKHHLTQRLLLFALYIGSISVLGWTTIHDILSLNMFIRYVLGFIIISIIFKFLFIRLMHFQEYQADDFAAKLGHAEAMAQALYHIDRFQRQPAVDRFASYFIQTHPHPYFRIKRIQKNHHLNHDLGMHLILTVVPSQE